MAFERVKSRQELECFGLRHQSILDVDRLIASSSPWSIRYLSDNTARAAFGVRVLSCRPAVRYTGYPPFPTPKMRRIVYGISLWVFLAAAACTIASVALPNWVHTPPPPSPAKIFPTTAYLPTSRSR